LKPFWMLHSQVRWFQVQFKHLALCQMKCLLSVHELQLS
jgi:hypothetical protein